VPLAVTGASFFACLALAQQADLLTEAVDLALQDDV
jgi:hypothetical protein